MNRPDWFPEQDWNDLLEHRKKKKAANTDRAMRAICKQVALAVERYHIEVSDVVDEITNRDWMGFKAEWMEGRNGSSPSILPKWERLDGHRN